LALFPEGDGLGFAGVGGHEGVGVGEVVEGREASAEVVDGGGARKGEGGIEDGVLML